MNIDTIKFNEVPENQFGLVIVECGLEHADERSSWVNAVTNHVKSAGCINGNKSDLPPWELWTDIRFATTTSGRVDLIFMGNSDDFVVGKLATVRLDIPNCGWIEDWLVNYADHYGCAKRGPHASAIVDLNEFDESD
jgi:hypothetical protein